MVEQHQGSVHLNHSFTEAFRYLKKNGSRELETAVNTTFIATASTARDGREVIRFFQKKLGKDQEYGRSYSCCWGHYHNCNRTRIGMYCKALDQTIC